MEKSTEEASDRSLMAAVDSIASIAASDLRRADQRDHAMELLTFVESIADPLMQLDHALEDIEVSPAYLILRELRDRLDAYAAKGIRPGLDDIVAVIREAARRLPAERWLATVFQDPFDDEVVRAEVVRVPASGYWTSGVGEAEMLTPNVAVYRTPGGVVMAVRFAGTFDDFMAVRGSRGGVLDWQAFGSPTLHAGTMEWAWSLEFDAFDACRGPFPLLPDVELDEDRKD